ncbi:MAG: DUF4832 domain-containing protein [Chitinophagaceae bacterium]|nr:MAG: DUF4832 domain-containing protein [Chitinophagaceae bacterium]
MRKFALLPVFLMILLASSAQLRTVTYKESREDLLNPERGFYLPSGTKASSFHPLDLAQLKSFRNTAQKPGRASYAVKVSLLYRGYELDAFRDRPLSDSFLVLLQKDFDVVREAGLKFVLRFMYTNKQQSGNCPDQFQICPPYGDAPRHIVLNHIRQLKPLLQANSDVIAVLQEGFIGIWGENYFTDYFGDASTNGTGRILDSSWNHRNELLAALLDAMPAGRMVQVRTPQIKQKFMYGPAAPVESLPLQASQAFDGSAVSRVGFHNDCFLASDDDYGTYYDNGSSDSPRKPANKILRKFIEDDTKYTVVGGETCDDAFSPANDCAPGGYAESEMRRMHYSYLNASYNNDVNNDWDSAGCLYNIRRQLGYRLVLKTASVPQQVKRKTPLSFRLLIENKGYASVYNPRPVKLVLRNVSTKKEYTVALAADPRRWSTGLHKISEQLPLPKDIPAGRYALLLSLPDAAESIGHRPEYSILLANEKMNEKATGYNDLRIIVRII